MDRNEPGEDHLPGPALRRATPLQLVALDVVLVILLGVLGTYLPPLKPTPYDDAVIHALIYALWFAVSIAFLFRRNYPRVVLGILLVLLFAGACMRSPAPASSYLAFALYSVVATSARRAGTLTAVGALAVAVLGIGISGGPLEIGIIAIAVANIVIGWVAGEYVRTIRRYSAVRAQLITYKAAAAEASRAERVSRAVAEERAKLARELHDVVAHGVSVVAVRAGVARMVLDQQPEQVREALGIIETTSRRTLQEMRLLVGVLRGDRDTQADREPAPGLKSLSHLIDQAELTGLDIELSIQGQPRSLAPTLDLSAYRIVQEALTNAARHAGPTTVNVILEYRSDSITIDVRDEGPRAGFVPDAELQQGAGHGLIGIRERAALFGGTCTAGPNGRGYRVRVTLNTGNTADADASDPDLELVAGRTSTSPRPSVAPAP